jgi:hypothetical protein
MQLCNIIGKVLKNPDEELLKRSLTIVITKADPDTTDEDVKFTISEIIQEL